jgi:cytochrome c553
MPTLRPLIAVMAPAAVLVAACAIAQPTGADRPFAAARKSEAATGAARDAAIAAPEPRAVSTPAGGALDARGLAATCAACHGTDGRASSGMPVLAGVAQATLATALLDFRAGRRDGTVMPQLAKGYTDPEIDALAAWFARLPATAPSTPARR